MGPPVCKLPRGILMWFLDSLLGALLILGSDSQELSSVLGLLVSGKLPLILGACSLSAFMPSCDFFPLPGSWQGGLASSFHLCGSLSTSCGHPTCSCNTGSSLRPSRTAVRAEWFSVPFSGARGCGDRVLYGGRLAGGYAPCLCCRPLRSLHPDPCSAQLGWCP